MALNFPDTPTVWQVFSAAGRQWTWNGESWDSAGTQLSAASPITYTDGEFAFDSVAFAKQENFELFYVKNSSGSSITKGSAVYISGANGDNALISLARANSEATSSKTLGLVYETIANDAFGYVVTSGKLTGINTASATAGDPVWLSPSTAGGLLFGLANKPTAANHMVYLGIVTRAHAQNGEIEVLVQNGYELDELHDVAIASPATGDIIQRDGSGLWVNKTIADAGIAGTNAPTIANPTLTIGGDPAVISGAYFSGDNGPGYWSAGQKYTNNALYYSTTIPANNSTILLSDSGTYTIPANEFQSGSPSFTVGPLVNVPFKVTGYLEYITGVGELSIESLNTLADWDTDYYGTSAKHLNTYFGYVLYTNQGSPVISTPGSSITVSAAEVSYLDGVTSNIQAQINGLQSTSPFLLMGA